MWHISLERKIDAIPSWLHKQAVAVLLSKCKATTLPDNQKVILHSLSTTAQSPYKTIWILCIEPDLGPLHNKKTHKTENKRPNKWVWP